MKMKCVVVLVTLSLIWLGECAHYEEVGGKIITHRKHFHTQGEVRVSAGGVRLVDLDGTPITRGHANTGLLEISVGGRWGRVCDNQFGKVDAVVACRSLGFESGTTRRRTNVRTKENPNDEDVPFSSMDIRGSNFQCIGDEQHLLDCQFLSPLAGSELGCLNTEDVAVECEGPGCVLPNGKFISVGQGFFDEAQCVDYTCLTGGQLVTETCPSCPPGTTAINTNVGACECPTCVSNTAGKCLDVGTGASKELGDEWNDATCRVCACGANERTTCRVGGCPKLPPCTAAGYVLQLNHCGCLECVWDESQVCFVNGKQFITGDVVTRGFSDQVCGRCLCDEGAITCENLACDVPDCPAWAPFNPSIGCCGGCSIAPGWRRVFPGDDCSDGYTATACAVENQCSMYTDMMLRGVTPPQNGNMDPCDCLWTVLACGETAGGCTATNWRRSQCALLRELAPRWVDRCRLDCDIGEPFAVNIQNNIGGAGQYGDDANVNLVNDIISPEGRGYGEPMDDADRMNPENIHAEATVFVNNNVREDQTVENEAGFVLMTESSGQLAEKSTPQPQNERRGIQELLRKVPQSSQTPSPRLYDVTYGVSRNKIGADGEVWNDAKVKASTMKVINKRKRIVDEDSLSLHAENAISSAGHSADEEAILYNAVSTATNSRQDVFGNEQLHEGDVNGEAVAVHAENTWYGEHLVNEFDAEVKQHTYHNAEPPVRPSRPNQPNMDNNNRPRPVENMPDMPGTAAWLKMGGSNKVSDSGVENEAFINAIQNGDVVRSKSRNSIGYEGVHNDVEAVAHSGEDTVTVMAENGFYSGSDGLHNKVAVSATSKDAGAFVTAENGFGADGLSNSVDVGAEEAGAGVTASIFNGFDNHGGLINNVDASASDGHDAAGTGFVNAMGPEGLHNSAYASAHTETEGLSAGVDNSIGLDGGLHNSFGVGAGTPENEASAGGENTFYHGELVQNEVGFGASSGHEGVQGGATNKFHDGEVYNSVGVGGGGEVEGFGIGANNNLTHHGIANEVEGSTGSYDDGVHFEAHNIIAENYLDNGVSVSAGSGATEEGIHADAHNLFDEYGLSNEIHAGASDSHDSVDVEGYNDLGHNGIANHVGVVAGDHDSEAGVMIGVGNKINEDGVINHADVSAIEGHDEFHLDAENAISSEGVANAVGATLDIPEGTTETRIGNIVPSSGEALSNTVQIEGDMDESECTDVEFAINNLVNADHELAEAMMQKDKQRREMLDMLPRQPPTNGMGEEEGSININNFVNESPQAVLDYMGEMLQRPQMPSNAQAQAPPPRDDGLNDLMGDGQRYDDGCSGGCNGGQEDVSIQINNLLGDPDFMMGRDGGGSHMVHELDELAEDSEGDLGLLDMMKYMLMGGNGMGRRSGPNGDFVNINVNNDLSEGGMLAKMLGDHDYEEEDNNSGNVNINVNNDLSENEDPMGAMNDTAKPPLPEPEYDPWAPNCPDKDLNININNDGKCQQCEVGNGGVVEDDTVVEPTGKSLFPQ